MPRSNPGIANNQYTGSNKLNINQSIDSAPFNSFKRARTFVGIEHKLDCRARSAGANKKRASRICRRAKLGDDGNQMQADGNSFPVFILGWTIAAGQGWSSSFSFLVWHRGHAEA
jgi:hypothetical protein